MADGSDMLSARTVSSIREIGRTAWDECAAACENARNPFISFDFLSSLEDSGSVGPGTGWAPIHLVIEQTGRALGAAPLYVKGHSQGEYVFDHHWADAFERAGGRYYPKLLCAAPFTPVPGPRLLAGDRTGKRALGAGLIEACKQLELSSAHVNFATEDDDSLLQDLGFLPRRGVQYHWFNRGYETFEGFLAALSSRKRKAIRRERQAVADSGLLIRRVAGTEITETHWDAFWAFYQDTGSRKWGRPYLTRTFFSLIGERMADRILLVLAYNGGRAVAGALNLIGGDALYGRYWGCTEDHPFLHFELCYYQAIDYAIEYGLARVEAGAQGEHKIARGYEPVETRSAHWIADPGLRSAVARYLAAERANNAEEIRLLSDYKPFRKG